MKISSSLPFLSLFLLAKAYTWQFTSQPSQCEDITITLQGSGKPPYRLLIVPHGSTPLPNGTEVRRVQDIPFSESSTTFKLPYPENSSFIAVVSDSSGFGSGGASIPVSILQSSDSSCYDASQTLHPAFDFYINPSNGLTQCETGQLWWGPNVVGTPYFYGIIPGGTAFPIPQGPLSSYNVTGAAFNWTVDMVPGTTLSLVGSDGRGIGSGGYAEFVISSTSNSSCLNDNSPSSTPGNPAGSYPTGSHPTGSFSTGSYPTGPSSPSTGDGRHSSSSNMGGIIGGAVTGAVVSGALVALYFLRRRRRLSTQRLVNILPDDEDRVEQNRYLPQHYVPEPYLFSHPTRIIGGASEITSTHDRPLSMTSADIQLLQTPTTARTPRKGAQSPHLRNSVIIQHDDAGPSDGLSEHSQFVLVEVPPAYTNLLQPQRASLATSAPTSPTADSDS